MPTAEVLHVKPGKVGASRPYLSTWNRERYSLAYLALGPHEDAVQAEILNALTAMGIRAWITDAGAKGVRARLARALLGLPIPRGLHARLLDAVKAVLPVGHSDIAGYMRNGRALFLEVKAPEQVDIKTMKQTREPGRPTAEQCAFLDRAAAAGCVAGVVWSLKDAIEIIRAADRAA